MELITVQPASALEFQSNGKGSATLKLKNVSSGTIAFKVKTTAPHSYLVRPSGGSLLKGQSEDVQITLQDVPLPNHRFLVQATAIEDPKEVSKEMWTTRSKDLIQESRISVTVVDAKEDAQPKDGGNAPDEAAKQSQMRRPETKPDEAAKPGDLQAKYDKLEQYTLSLETAKKNVEEQLAKSEKAHHVTKGRSAQSGWSNSHMMIMAVLVLLLSLAASKFIGQ